MPMEAWHIFTILGKPVNPVAAVDNFDKRQQELVEEWLRALGRKHAHDDSVKIDEKLVNSPMSCIVPMRAMEVTVFVLWESGTSMALLEQACKSLLISLLTKAGFF